MRLSRFGILYWSSFSSQSEAVSQETTQNNQTSEVTTETSVVENTEVQTDQAVTQNDTAILRILSLMLFFGIIKLTSHL